MTVHVDRTAVIDIISTGTTPFNPGVFTSSQSKLFSESKDPSSKYLMETRSQYIDLSRFFGSDYFLSKIGYNESKDWNMARRGTANISEILYAKLYFHLKKPKTCTLRIWLFC